MTKRELVELLIENKAVNFVSGKETELYIDCRMLTLSSGIRSVCGDIESELYRKCHFFPSIIGGTTMGADPIVACMVSFSRCSKGFLVRKQAKDHGMGKILEGHPPTAEDDVVIVDDVATTGFSAQIAIDIVKDLGAKVSAVCVILDREEGARQLFESQGIQFLPLLTLSELKSYLC